MSLGTAVEIGEIGARLSEGRVDVGGRLKALPGATRLTGATALRRIYGRAEESLAGSEQLGSNDRDHGCGCLGRLYLHCQGTPSTACCPTAHQPRAVRSASGSAAPGDSCRVLLRRREQESQAYLSPDQCVHAHRPYGCG